jgi:hypothetical protein
VQAVLFTYVAGAVGIPFVQGIIGDRCVVNTEIIGWLKTDIRVKVVSDAEEYILHCIRVLYLWVELLKNRVYRPDRYSGMYFEGSKL